ncbi:dTDP-4-dehydrorhamnose 3,5-epimerase [Pseudooceanicola sp. C21-150M6]|uniref:dTDP-4-dehydrorhamnose 3,5-epimerase n=1 Tax=Pseudooceanicola sp. C21-150M6 TaxID=3434355 RepID=UPI003D7F86FA
MIIEKTEIPEVLSLVPARFADDRGMFSESWSRRTLESHGLNLPDFVQDNHSLSVAAGTVRGLHFQSPPHAQGKLVRCGRGRLFDVAVDIRTGSATYGAWVGRELCAELGRQLWIPAGFLHGFVTLEPNTEIVYKCTDYYAPDCDGSVHWQSCGISWPLPPGTEPILSEKDQKAPAFSTLKSPFKMGDA